jgi:hypothetical protein
MFIVPVPWLRDEASYSDVLIEGTDLTDQVARDCSLDQVQFRGVSLMVSAPASSNQKAGIG